MRIALYSRYSSDQQNERSIEDQLRLCRTHAQGLGGTIVGEYADYALSGATLRTRPEAQRLMADAAAKRFDLVLIEALDRISRDQEDVAHIYKRLLFAGVKFRSVSEGEINELHIGMKGTMNALFLKDLAAKIRRGQVGRAVAGASPGGLTYGYEVVRTLDAKGELIRGGRKINEAEAAIVRRIYRDFANGVSPRAIAARLNRERILSPRGKAWGASTIGGGRGRGTGILWNEIYGGRLVYNRTTFVKNPETGRRVSRINPRAEWILTPAEHLRIVDEAIWQKVRDRRDSYSGQPLHQTHRPRHMFSGLLVCAECGAGYVVRRRDELACNGRHERGNCGNSSSVKLGEVERRVLEGLRLQILDPGRIARFIRTYHAERRRLREEERNQLAGLRRRQREIAAELDRYLDALGQGLASVASLKDKILTLDAEKRRIADALAAEEIPESYVELHPQTIITHQRRVSDLAEALNSDEESRHEAVAALRDLISHIEIGRPAQKGDPVTINAYGLLPRVLAFAQGKPGKDKRSGNSAAASVVAGERLARDPRRSNAPSPAGIVKIAC